MELKKLMSWLSSNDFATKNPVTCVILDVVQQERDLVLKFQLENLQERQMSLWKDNRNALIDGFGTNTDLWKNKKFLLREEHKIADGKDTKIRTIIALP